MAHTSRSNIKLNLAADIDCLSSKIISIVNDKTVELAARGIAQHILLSENKPLAAALGLFDKPGADKVVWKLIASQSEFMGPTPRSIGIDLVSECSVSKIQSSLDVKHIKKNDDSKERALRETVRADDDSDSIDRIKPHRKIDLAYSHPTYIWVRFYSKQRGIAIRNTTILPVSENVYELYCSKNRQLLFGILATLEQDYSADLILCSELPAFLPHPLLFLSNYIKFMWCYDLNRDIFDPTSYEDIRIMTQYVTYGLLFLNTNNLSSMPTSTHGPMISCSGERPKVALGKFNAATEYTNEGSRAMQSVNKPSDFGTYSNYVEVITEVRIGSCLERIV